MILLRWIQNNNGTMAATTLNGNRYYTAEGGVDVRKIRIEAGLVFLIKKFETSECFEVFRQCKLCLCGPG